MNSVVFLYNRGGERSNWSFPILRMSCAFQNSRRRKSSIRVACTPRQPAGMKSARMNAGQEHVEELRKFRGAVCDGVLGCLGRAWLAGGCKTGPRRPRSGSRAGAGPRRHGSGLRGADEVSRDVPRLTSADVAGAVRRGHPSSARSWRRAGWTPTSRCSARLRRPHGMKRPISSLHT